MKYTRPSIDREDYDTLSDTSLIFWVTGYVLVVVGITFMGKGINDVAGHFWSGFFSLASGIVFFWIVHRSMDNFREEIEN